MADVKIDGVWLRSLGNVSDVTWSSRWGAGLVGGPELASCTLAVDPADDSSLLRLARRFEVFDDGVKVFSGITSELGRDFPRSISAKSLAKRAADFNAVDASGNPTTNPHTAVEQAIARGLPWTNEDAFDDASLGVDDAGSMQTVESLLNQWSVTVGKSWGVDVEGVAFASVDPTTPTWFLDASDLDLGVADDGLFTRVAARYVTTVDGDGNPTAWATVTADDAVGQAEFDIIEYPMPLEGLGILVGGSTTALAYAQQQLDLLTIPQWLSRVTTNSSRLLTPGGLPVNLSSVRAGQMVRMFNVPRSLGGLRSELGLDVALGEVSYNDSSPSEVTLAPVGLAVRNLADALAQAKQAADAVKSKAAA